MTGLYNRKYLDEFIDKKMPQELASGTTYAVNVLRYRLLQNGK